MAVLEELRPLALVETKPAIEGQDFDMIELFGSPAGRALTVNNRTAAELHLCSKSNSSSNIASISNNSASTTQNHSALCQQPLYHPLQNCGFSGTCSTISAAANHSSHHSTASTANCNKFVDSSDLIRYRANHPQPHSHHPVTTHLPTGTPTTNHAGSSSRTNSKMAKIWKLFDEDRIQNKGSSSTNATTTTSSNSGSEFFSRCHSRRKSNPSEEKSTKDLYNEAAQLLGIRCTLSDSCRCIDCQSQYFDCDDFDSYSEYSDRSYDPEDTFVVNQSYFTSNDTGHHSDLSEVVCQQHHQANPSGITDINGQKDEFDGAENENNNGNNKNDQYSRHEGIAGQVFETEGGRMRRRKCNDTEICSEQQDDSSSISARDYAVANGINELEMNSNLVA